MKKSELLLNPYKEHLKKPYLHGAGTLEINGVQYSADEYITMLEEENKNLRYELNKFSEAYKKYRDFEKEELADSLYDMEQENKKLKDIIGNIVYLYKEEPTELGEYVKSGFKCGMSN